MPSSANLFRLPVVLLMLCLWSLQAQAVDRDDDDMEGVTQEELQQQDIPVDERIFMEHWNEVPFDKDYFTLNHAQIKQKWPQITRSLLIPYPSAAYLREQFTKHRFLRDELIGFDGNFQALEKRYVEVVRLFLRGDFQAAREEGLKLGAIGKGISMLSQIVYASYLTEKHSVKQMLLQDAMNIAKDYLPKLEELERDPQTAPYAALVRLCYTYAMARIAEESPIPVAVARNYIPRVKSNAEHILQIMPDHPVAHAFLAGVNANIMRRVGKLTGRMTYQARTTNVEESFKRAIELVPDMALVLYEKANAEIYVNRRRNINDALAALEKAVRLQPLFAMEALDSMYAFKRLKEVRLYAQSYRSFRKFDKARRKFARKTDRNLTNVSTPALTREMLENPEPHQLASAH